MVHFNRQVRRACGKLAVAGTREPGPSPSKRRLGSFFAHEKGWFCTDLWWFIVIYWLFIDIYGDWFMEVMEVEVLSKNDDIVSFKVCNWMQLIREISAPWALPAAGGETVPRPACEGRRAFRDGRRRKRNWTQRLSHGNIWKLLDWKPI